MANILFIARLDVTRSIIDKLKLLLKHQVRFWLVVRVDAPFIAIVGVEEKLVVVAARDGGYFFSEKAHGCCSSVSRARGLAMSAMVWNSS